VYSFLKTLAEANTTNQNIAEDAAAYRRRLQELLPEDRLFGDH
jgi:hypothetical protein